MLKHIRMMLCRHTFEYEWKCNTNQFTKCCRKCGKEM